MSADLPSRHDGVTITCPICQHPFSASGRRRYCSDACRAAAYRRRRNAGHTPVVVPADQPRRPITIYECDDCGARALGQQRCADCSTFMRRIGIVGCCPQLRRASRDHRTARPGGDQPDLTYAHTRLTIPLDTGEIR